MEQGPTGALCAGVVCFKASLTDVMPGNQTPGDGSADSRSVRMIWKGGEIGEDRSINVGLDLDSACGKASTVTSSCSIRQAIKFQWSLLIGWSGPMRSLISTVTTTAMRTGRNSE